MYDYFLLELLKGFIGIKVDSEKEFGERLLCGVEWVRVQAVAYRGRGGVGGFNPPPPEIPKDLQNRAKLKPFVKTVKNS